MSAAPLSALLTAACVNARYFRKFFWLTLDIFLFRFIINLQLEKTISINYALLIGYKDAKTREDEISLFIFNFTIAISKILKEDDYDTQSRMAFSAKWGIFEHFIGDVLGPP